MEKIEKSKFQSKKEQEISREDFEKLLMKVESIVFGIMRNIELEKVKPLEFKKNEEGKESALLKFRIEEKGCRIKFKVSEESKQELQKKSMRKIIESFITQHLVNYGISGYLDDKCPECKQTTLTKTSVMNNPSEEAIACNLCEWAGFMATYKEYLNYKKEKNCFLEFPEWWKKRNNYEI